MTRRERLERCYRMQETDRPAVYSRSLFPRDDPTYDGLKAYLAAHSELKSAWDSGVLEAAEPWERRIEPHTEDFDRRVEILHTPAGDLRRAALVSRKGQPGLHETYLINNAEEAEKYLSLPLSEPAGDAAAFFDRQRDMGDRGIVEVSLGINPGGFAAELCGSENFALMSVTDREVLHRLCRRRCDLLLRRVKYLLSRSVGPFFSLAGQELIVPPLHGPADFDDFNLRYDRPIIDLIHEAGGRVHVHCHGSIRRVFGSLLAAGIDVLHPFEPPPLGDIAAREAKALARGRMCLEGNIQIHRMYECAPGEIAAETEQLIRDAFDDRRGLIVSPTASPYIRGAGEVCFPQYKAMIDTVLRFGRR